jgi:hypothetical protein
MERDSLGSDAEIIDGSDEFAGTGYDADTSVEHIKSPLPKIRVPESYKTAYFEITHELAAEQRKNFMLSSKNDKLESENSELKATIKELEIALETLTVQVTKGASTLKGGTLKRRKKRVSTRKK